MAEWSRGGKYFETNGRYNVCAIRFGGTWLFEAWCVASRPAVRIAGFSNATAARAAAEEHHLGRQQ